MREMGGAGRDEGKVWNEWKNVGGGVRKCVGVWGEVLRVCWGGEEVRRSVGRSGGVGRC